MVNYQTAMQNRFQKVFSNLDERPNQTWWMVGFITLLAGILRFYKLGSWGLWEDEIPTMLRARSVFQNVLGDFNVVLNVLFREEVSDILIYLPLKLFGMTEWNARLIPALIGIASIPILYFLIVRMFSTRVALLSVLLLALSTWHIHWSQNARFYTPLLLFYTLALFFFYFGIEKNRISLLLISMFLLYLATRERLFALFFLPIAIGYFLLLWLFSYKKPEGYTFKNFLFLVLSSGLIGLLLGVRFVKQPSAWTETFSYVTDTPFFLFTEYVEYMDLPVLVIGAIGAVYLFLKKNRAALLLSIAALIPIVVVLVVSPFQFVSVRYAFLTLPFWLILASVVAIQLVTTPINRNNFFAMAIVLTLVISPIKANYLYYQYQNGHRANWKAAFQLVEERKQNGDIVATNTHALGKYYLEEIPIDMVYLNPKFVELAGAEGKRVWFVHNNRRISPTFVQWIEENSELVEVLDVHIGVKTYEMRVFLYEPKSESLIGSKE